VCGDCALAPPPARARPPHGVAGAARRALPHRRCHAPAVHRADHGLRGRQRAASYDQVPEHGSAGGLIAYGASVPALLRRAATYVDKILKGATPADLPVEQPMKFALIINLKTAKVLGLTIPHTSFSRRMR
jgi:hypothetical protein